MVREQNISNKEFMEMDAEQRDAELLRVYSITGEDLSTIRAYRKSNPILAMIRATKVLYDKSGGELASVPLYLIGNMVFELDSAESNDVTARAHLRTQYKERRDDLLKRDLFVPYISFLTENLRITDSNLIHLKEHEVYPRFHASREDFIKGVKLPENIGYKESQLLGMVWANSFIIYDNNGNKSTEVIMAVNRKKKDLYEGTVSEMIKDIFNASTEFSHIDSINSDDEQYTNTLFFSSPAAISWLIYDLGMGSGKDHDLPDIEYDKKGFLEGVIAAKARMISPISSAPYLSLNFRDENVETVQIIYDLFNELGFTTGRVGKRKKSGTKEYEPSLFVQLGQEQVSELNMINPSHEEKSQKHFHKLPINAKHYIRSEDKTTERMISDGLALMKLYNGVMPPSHKVKRITKHSWLLGSAVDHFEGFKNYREFMRLEYDMNYIEEELFPVG